MDINRKKALHIGKENNCEHFNKRDSDGLLKDRLLALKRHEEGRELKELRVLRNSKEVRGVARSVQEKVKGELKPLAEAPSITQQYCQAYGGGVVAQSEEERAVLGPFLNAHDIDKQLRARMLDWMIEVTSSYKFTAKTYFASVELMDRYFKAEEARLPITRLHIIGVVSMLVATKMDEVFPLKVKTVYEKIVHKKIDKRDLVEMEARLVAKLDFALNVWSFHDLALLKLHDACPARSEDALRELELLCEYIGKFVVFNYELFSHYDAVVLSEALLRAAFRVFGAEKARLLAGERAVERELSKDAMVCLELIFDTMRTFKSTFKSISNIYKFTEPACVEQVEAFLRNH